MSKKHIFLSIFSKITIFACVFCAFFISPVFATLPAGYTEVEYIDNNGTAWLDLGMPIGSESIVTFDMEWNGRITAPFFGAYNTGGSFGSQSFVGTYYQNSTNLTFYANSDTPLGISPKPTGRILLKWNGTREKPTVDGVEIGSVEPPYYDFTPTENAYLFTRNQGGTAGTTDDINMYGFKVERNGSVIMNLVPAKRNSDNVIGMYDIANSGKNLFDINETKISTLNEAKVVTKPTYAGVNQGAVWSVGNNATFGAHAFGIVIPCKTGETYTIKMFNSSALGSSGRYTYAEMNTSGVVTKGNASYMPSGTTITAENTGFLCIQFAVNTTQEAVEDAQIMVVKGDIIPTSYEPYPFYTNAGTGTFIAGPEKSITDIQIATTKFVDDEFAQAEANLATTVQTIESVVSRTIAQTGQIQVLQDTKQTRPDETCPANMKCLLVQDEDGTPHWYPIIEP